MRFHLINHCIAILSTLFLIASTSGVSAAPFTKTSSSAIGYTFASIEKKNGSSNKKVVLDSLVLGKSDLSQSKSIRCDV